MLLSRVDFAIGNIPETIGNCVNLERINFDNSNLSSGPFMGAIDLFFSRQSIFYPGEIPESIGKCSKLGWFDVSKNILSGELRTGTNCLIF